MKCTQCGSSMEKSESRLPFRLSDHRIVIFEGLPVYECTNCQEYLLEDSVMARIDELLSNVEKQTELEIINYAA